MQNLTPHPITIRTPDGEITIAPSGALARVEMVEAALPGIALGGIVVPTIRRNAGMVVGLPRDAGGVPLPCLVSSLVLAALPAGTPNVYAPDTGASAIRDARGQVVAVTRLVAA